MKKHKSLAARVALVAGFALAISACATTSNPVVAPSPDPKVANTLELLNLQIDGGVMVPASFIAANRDYGVYCSKTTQNTLTFKLSLPKNVTATIDNEVVANSKQITANANQLIRIELRRDKDFGAYWIRCLPPNFPVFRMERPSEAPSGWYVLTGIGESEGLAQSYGVILNAYGAPVWYRAGKDTFDPQGIPLGPMGLQVLSDGSLAWFEAQGMAFGVSPNEGFERFSPDGTPIATYRVSEGYSTNHHELLELPDGGFLLNSVNLEAPKRPTECWTSTGKPGEYKRVKADLVGGARIERLDASGKSIWSWDADYQGSLGKPEDSRIDTSETTDPMCWLNAKTKKYLMSGIHPNSLDMEGDLIIMSSRNTDAVYGIDSTTGKIVFKFGGTYRKGVSLKFDGDESDLPHAQHDVRLAANGRLTLYNNRPPLPDFLSKYQAKGPAAFMEYKIDLQQRTATLIRSYPHPDGVKSPALGSSRVMEDGSVLVGWGSSTSNLVATEFANDGRVLMNLRTDVPRFIYRVLKFGPERLNADQLREGVNRIAVKR